MYAMTTSLSTQLSLVTLLLAAENSNIFYSKYEKKKYIITVKYKLFKKSIGD